MTPSATNTSRDFVAPYDPTTQAGTAGGAALYRADRLEDRYARALYELAADKNAIDSVLTEAKALSAGIASSPELLKVLKNPTMSRDEQAKVLAGIAAKLNAGKLMQNFLQLIAKKRRQAALPAIMEAFQTEVARQRGELLAEVTSAAQLTDAQTAMLTAALSKQHGNAKISLTLKTDPNLIGGLMVRVGSRLYDRTVAGQLNRLQQKLNAA